jgi:hypothetical protein
LIFIGSAQARICDEQDRKLDSKNVLMQVPDSPWVEHFLECYIQEYGTKLLPVVKDVKHYVVRGHEYVIGILARNVEMKNL